MSNTKECDNRVNDINKKHSIVLTSITQLVEYINNLNIYKSKIPINSDIKKSIENLRLYMNDVAELINSLKSSKSDLEKHVKEIIKILELVKKINENDIDMEYDGDYDYTVDENKMKKFSSDSNNAFDAIDFIKKSLNTLFKIKSKNDNKLLELEELNKKITGKNYEIETQKTDIANLKYKINELELKIKRPCRNEEDIIKLNNNIDEIDALKNKLAGLNHLYQKEIEESNKLKKEIEHQMSLILNIRKEESTKEELKNRIKELEQTIKNDNETIKLLSTNIQIKDGEVKNIIDNHNTEIKKLSDNLNIITQKLNESDTTIINDKQLLSVYVDTLEKNKQAILKMKTDLDNKLNEEKGKTNMAIEQYKKQNELMLADITHIFTNVVNIINNANSVDQSLNPNGLSDANKININNINKDSLIILIDSTINAFKSKVIELISRIKTMKEQLKSISKEFGYTSDNPINDMNEMTKKLKEFIEYTTNQSDINEGLVILRKSIRILKTHPNYAISGDGTTSLMVIANLMEQEKKGNIVTKIPSIKQLINQTNIANDIIAFDNERDITKRFNMLFNIEDKIDNTISILNKQRNDFVKKLGLDENIPIEELINIFESKYNETQILRETIITVINSSDIEQKLDTNVSDKNIIKSIKTIIQKSNEYKFKISELQQTIDRTAIDDKNVIEILNGISFDDDYKTNINKIKSIGKRSDLYQKLVEFLALKENYDIQIITFATSYGLEKKNNESNIELLVRTIQFLDDSYNSLEDISEDKVKLLNGNIRDRNSAINSLKNKLKTLKESDEANKIKIKELNEEIIDKDKQIEELIIEVDSLTMKIQSLERDKERSSNELLGELTKLRNENIDLNNKINSLELANQELNNRIESINNNNEKLNNDIKTLEKQISKIVTENDSVMEEATNKIIDLQEINTSLGQKLKNLSDNNKNEEMEHSNKIISLQESIQSLEKKIQDLTDDTNNNETDHLNKIKMLQELNETLEQKLQELVDTSTNNDDENSNKIKSLQTINETLEQRLQKLTSNLSDEETECNDKIKSLQMINETIDQQLQDIESKSKHDEDECNNKINSLRESTKDLEQKLQELESHSKDDEDKCKDKINSLQESTKDLEQKLQELENDAENKIKVLELSNTELAHHLQEIMNTGINSDLLSSNRIEELESKQEELDRLNIEQEDKIKELKSQIEEYNNNIPPAENIISNDTKEAIISALEIINNISDDNTVNTLNNVDNKIQSLLNQVKILNDKDDILKLLLDLRANTNFVDEKGRNLIHTTIFKDKEKYIKIISQYNNTIINQADSFGAKPINYAAFMGKKSVVLELIDLGASINNANKKSPNILEFLKRYHKNILNLSFGVDDSNNKSNLNKLAENMILEFEIDISKQ